MIERIKLAIAPYLLWIKIAFCIGLIAVGAYVTHLYYKNQLAEAVVAQMKADAALAEYMAKVNTDFVSESVKTEVRYVYRDKVIEKYIPIDKVTEGFVEFYNAAVENRELKPMTYEEANAVSNKTLVDVGAVTNANYSNCNKYIKQVTALQNILKEIEGGK